MVSQRVSSISGISERMSVCDWESWRVVDERSGGRHDSARSGNDSRLSISRSLAVVTKVSQTVITNSDRDGVSGHLMRDLSGSIDDGLHHRSVGHGPNWGEDRSSSIRKSSTVEELGVGLSCSESQES